MSEKKISFGFANLGKGLEINRPKPIIANIDVVPYKRRMDPEYAIEALIEGHSVLITDFYSSGLTVLNALKEYVKNKYSDQSFHGQREFRSVFRELSHRILVLVKHHKLSLRKAPEIGWLEKLYPSLNEFLLPFPQVQGLNSSWQWYEKGISIPVLDKKLHPFFGTYFPTRFEHLVVFDKWLKKYSGEKKSAIDIGIGSGVISFQLLKHKFETVYGTDSNPNAIIGLSEDKEASKIALKYGDLFADIKDKTELIVFNPPWIPASQNTEGLDKAIYYDEDLFPRFFTEAKKHLKPRGKVVLLFSNLAQITKTTELHPIKIELLNGGRFQKELFIEKNVKLASTKTKRNQNWRIEEKVELWVLKSVDD